MFCFLRYITSITILALEMDLLITLHHFWYGTENTILVYLNLVTQNVEGSCNHLYVIAQLQQINQTVPHTKIYIQSDAYRR